MQCPVCNSESDGRVCRSCGYTFPAASRPAESAGHQGPAPAGPGAPPGAVAPPPVGQSAPVVQPPPQAQPEPIGLDPGTVQAGQPAAQQGGPDPAQELYQDATYVDPYNPQDPGPVYGATNSDQFGGQPPTRKGDGATQTRRWVLPVILGGAALVVAAAVLFAFVLPAIFPSSAATPTYGPATGNPSTSTTGTVGPSVSQTPAAAAGVDCWNESKADTVEDCPAPIGAEASYQYLRYAYPSLASHTFCDKQDSTGKSDYTGTTVMWNCELGTSLLRYRYWEKASDGTRHYNRKFAGKNTRVTYDVHLEGSDVALKGYAKEETDRVKDAAAGTNRYVTSVWLPDYHLSLSAEGDTRLDMRKALELARIRPPEQLMGHASGEDPRALGFTFTKH